MTASREMDQSDFDLETFVDLFDTAMTSDNPAVKKAFKNLLLVASIVHAREELDSKQGPLRRLVDDIRNLNRKLSDLESEKNQSGRYITPVPMPTTPGWPSPTTPTWAPNTGWPPGTIVGYTDTSTGTPIAGTRVLGVLEKLENK
jgi:hypothetical protein